MTWARTPTACHHQATIYVRGLAPGCTEEDVQALLTAYGHVVSVKVRARAQRRAGTCAHTVIIAALRRLPVLNSCGHLVFSLFFGGLSATGAPLATS